MFVCDLLQLDRETATNFLYRTTDLLLDLCEFVQEKSQKPCKRHATLQLISVLRRQALPALCDMQRMPRMPHIRMLRMLRMPYKQFPCEPFSTAWLQFLQVHVVMNLQHDSKKEESRAIGMPYRSQTKSNEVNKSNPTGATSRCIQVCKWFQ